MIAEEERRKKKSFYEGFIYIEFFLYRVIQDAYAIGVTLSDFKFSFIEP